MNYLENNFAQVEHLNQIIYNNDGFDDWEYFIANDLLEQFPQLGSYDKENPSKSKIVIPATVTDRRGEYVRGHYNIRYNSFIVSIERFWEKNSKNENIEYYRYTFEVRNTLWDGGYKIFKPIIDKNGNYENYSPDEVEVLVGYDDEDSSIKNGNLLIIVLSGNDKDKLNVAFHMTTTTATRNIATGGVSLILDEVNTELEQDYNREYTEKGKVYLSNGKKANNVTITLEPCDDFGRVVTEGIPRYELKNAPMEFNIKYGKVDEPNPVGNPYTCLLTATCNRNNQQLTTSLVVNVNKKSDAVIEPKMPEPEIIKGTLGITKLEDEQFRNVWKGSKRKYRIPIEVSNSKEVNDPDIPDLTGIPVDFYFKDHNNVLKQNVSSQIEWDSKNKVHYAEAVINYRGFYEESSKLAVNINHKYFGKIYSEKNIDHPWFIAKTYNDVLGELYLINKDGKYVDTNGKLIGDGTDVSRAVENDYGTDWIFLENNTFNVTQPLHIKRTLTIASINSGKHSTFNGNSKNIIHTSPNGYDASNLMKVNIIGVSFKDAECAVYSDKGTRLLIDRCYFTGNHNTAQMHKGCSIYIPDDDENIKHPNLWKTEIRNSYFKNNKGNEIQSCGTTRIDNCLFITTDAQYLQQPEVKVVSVRSGTVTYTNNKSYIHTGSSPMKSNHSYAKALAFVEHGAKFNGRGPNELGGDMKLPLYGTWNNQAYTYAIYYYPYENVRTEIVCSPRKGYERKATGHASSIKGWVYYDGYDFVRWNKGRNKGNTHNPWTADELKIPDSLGIYKKDLRSNGKYYWHFINDYNPIFSGAKSMVSIFDNKKTR